MRACVEKVDVLIWTKSLDLLHKARYPSSSLKIDALKIVTNYKHNCNKTLDRGVQGRILRPFTNSTNSAPDFRVKKRTLCPLAESKNLALDFRMKKRTLCTYTDSTNLTLYLRVQNGHRRVQNSHAKKSPPLETVTAVKNGHRCAKRSLCISATGTNNVRKRQQ